MITGVRIVTGTTALGPSESPTVDVVVMDDFLYGEPQAIVPEPSTVISTGTALILLAYWGRKRLFRGRQRVKAI